LNTAQHIYEQLWQKAAAAFETGSPQIDACLQGKTADPRRGVTLVLRPDRMVQQAIAAFLDEAREVAPNQYFYRPEEFHITVLAIIPGSEQWQDKIRRLDACRPIIGRVLAMHPAFSVEFKGVTAAPDAVLVQGFPVDDTLTRIRNDLRAELRESELGNELDRRYRIHAAHLTAMRFCRPDADWKRLKKLLEANRETSFGLSRANSLQLVLTDWYASASRVEVLENYRLGAQ